MLIVKFCTFNVAVPLRDWPPAVPVAVRVYVWPMVAAVVDRVTLKVAAAPLMVTELGHAVENVGGAPGDDGVMAQLMPTVPLKPFKGVTVTVYGALLWVATMVCVAGEMVTWKSCVVKVEDVG